MADITISYEDALRLSELQGQLAQLNYQSSHWAATHLSDIALIICVTAFIMCVVLWFYHTMYYGDDWDGSHSFFTKPRKPEVIEHEKRIYYLGMVGIIVGFIIIAALLEYGCYIGSMANIELQEADAQAQIDVIMSKYT